MISVGFFVRSYFFPQYYAWMMRPEGKWLYELCGVISVCFTVIYFAILAAGRERLGENVSFLVSVYTGGLLIAGSYGMGGAAVLAARACMRSGIGLLTVHSPICNHQLLQTIVPEAMVQDDVHERFFAEPTDLDNYQAMAIGPGLSQEEITAQAALDQVSNCFIPLVLDADALNIFSAYRSYLNRLPKHSILTPHVKELERLVGRCSNSFERLSKAKELAGELQVYIILKGAWTTVITPEGNCYFNPTGNPGMATGGSGDVLTGILLSLLAQGYTQEEACRLGVYIHGLAGDIACMRMGEISMTAGDIVNALPEAWKKLTTSK